MEIAVAIGLVIVGGIIGFFVARHWYGRGPTQASIEQAEEELKALLSQQSEHHIFQSKQLIQNIEKQCASLSEQLSAYQSLLAPQEGEGNQGFTFFGEHATTYLRNQVGNNNKRVPHAQTDTQPRDFASAPSGLFVGQPENENNNEDGTNSKS